MNLLRIFSNTNRYKIQGSSLYIVIVIALVVGTLCSSLIVSAYFYRLQYQRKFRIDKLQNNLESGISILLSSDSSNNYNGKEIELFADTKDSIIIKNKIWGLYDIGIVKSFFQNDTLTKVFSFAQAQNAELNTALYLTDEEVPLYVSGKTFIKGDAYLPKAGVKESFLEGLSYAGDKNIVNGSIKSSSINLPGLNRTRLKFLSGQHKSDGNADSSYKQNQTIENSFLKSVKVISLKSEQALLQNINFKGNIMIISEGEITIDSTCHLDNVQLYASSIYVKSGFKGNAQMFANKLIEVDSNCVFNYPTVLSVIKLPVSKSYQQRIVIGDNTILKGVIFSYEDGKSDAQTLIDLGNKVYVEGEIYSKGLVRLKNWVIIDGSIRAHKLIYETNSTMFENYLVNATINAKNISPYYLSSPIFIRQTKERKVLSWLK